jgi:hypothetical protein
MAREILFHGNVAKRSWVFHGHEFKCFFMPLIHGIKSISWHIHSFFKISWALITSFFMGFSWVFSWVIFMAYSWHIHGIVFQ